MQTINSSRTFSKANVAATILLGIGALLFLFYFFCSEERLVVLSCRGTILNTAQEFSGVAKKFALKKNPNTTRIAVASSEHFIDDDSAPTRYLFHLVLYRSGRQIVKENETTYLQDKKTVAVMVSVCADVMSYTEISTVWSEE
jgi:hypothetical protein